MGINEMKMEASDQNKKRRQFRGGVISFLSKTPRYFGEACWEFHRNRMDQPLSFRQYLHTPAALGATVIDTIIRQAFGPSRSGLGTSDGCRKPTRIDAIDSIG